MIRHLNRMYWLGYLGVIYVIYALGHHFAGMTRENAFVLGLGLVFGLLFLAHLGFHAGGFALSFSAKQLPQIKDKKLPFQEAGEVAVRRLTPWEWVWATWTESWASYKLVTWLQPWKRHTTGIILGERQWRKTKPLPVLLIHGYLCNAAVWSATRERLNRQHVTTHAITLEPAIGSIRHYAPQIHEAVEELLAATGAPQIKILAHSMGGVAARYYATVHGHDKIAGALTLGSPHYGTSLSMLGIGKNVKQMAWSSFFLRQLRAHPVDPEFQKKIISVWSGQDNIVSPPCSSELEHAKNIVINGVGHVALVSHPMVIDLIQNWLAEDAQSYGESMRG